ncbi:hypothetical protein JOD55_000404 [Arcanobacterium pluranimalium]|uniref:hypothetical protein n=1 Tax=Arcanobacterium pluranimalium TaxID=108028 RepID=UPI001958DF5E|nr:hypothetical protein [Arcanobacterium pluranimalium]MBM7824577.1 hypothetical protein [Arcanobacterium pluranimalium]
MEKPHSHKVALEIDEETDRRGSGVEPEVPAPTEHQTDSKVSSTSQQEPHPFHEIVDYSKLQYGQRLICCCICLVVILSVIGYAWGGDDPSRSELHSAIELLKLVTTTALGFVFAKTHTESQHIKTSRSAE